MRFGIPVACSSHGSLPEIAGKAALFFDPTNTEQIADTILNIKFDRKIREELIKFDIENLQRFDWEKAAKSTTDIYKIISSDL
jgi:glycosyltransferase involved in cell wall biosynthesis